MKTTSIIIGTALAVTVFAVSCQKESIVGAARVPVLPDTPYAYENVENGANGFVPNGIIAIDNEKATLGRVLFYETQLSRNNRVSCGSCHAQSLAFADRTSVSNGFENGKTTRNTPAIINAGTQNSFFWDMRESSLASMVTKPIANHVEMGLNDTEYILAKVESLPYYKELFNDAYGSSEISMDRIGDALSCFVAAITSSGSKYDRVMKGLDSFSPEEQHGQQLFTITLPCSQCHGGENFSGWGTMTQNIGLEMDYADNGQPGIHWENGEPLDGWFKVPSLRNIALTAPYMHDGRFQTLEEVVEFYNSGIQPHPQLSFALMEGWNGIGIFDGDVPPFGNPTTGNPVRLNLSEYDKESLIAFLKSLTDENITTDVKFSDPFVVKN